MKKERTFKSLQVSRQHWINSSRIHNNIKEKIDEIYFSEYNRKNKTPEEIYQEIIHLKIGQCPICNYDIFVGISCPNILPSGNRLPKNPTKGQIMHFNSWKENNQKGIDERDNSYIIERNKTEKMRESSRKVGLKTGSSNLKKAHEKYDKIISCSLCNDEECKVRNLQKSNTFLIGVGCLTKHNNTDIMKETTTQRNLYNWNNDEEYRKRIASNLGDKLGANIHDFSYNIDCNENCKYYKNCKNKDNKNLLKK